MAAAAMMVSTMKDKRVLRSKGFSLLELMIVVAIISILAAIAWPQYMRYAQRSNRSDGKVALTQMAQRLERCYTSFNRYNSPNCTAATQLTVGGGINSDAGFYAITVGFPNDLSFTLAANAANSPQTSDTGCTTLTLDNTGNRTPAECW
jgi:type IV pilus assembly protein PilE